MLRITVQNGLSVEKKTLGALVELLCIPRNQLSTALHYPNSPQIPLEADSDALQHVPLHINTSFVEIGPVSRGKMRQSMGNGPINVVQLHLFNLCTIPTLSFNVASGILTSLPHDYLQILIDISHPQVILWQRGKTPWCLHAIRGPEMPS